MRCAAANDAAQRNHTIEATRARYLVDSQRHFERAWDANNFDIGIDRAMLLQATDRRLEQRLNDKVIETRRDDRKARVPNDQVAFRCLDLVHRAAALFLDVLGDLEIETGDRIHVLGC